MSVFISWVCVALFGVSMLSGVIVAFVYKPSLAYESVQMLTYIIPYGDFFRKLHYFSSEAFFVFTLLHLILELIKLKVKISVSSWNYSVLAFVILFALMFSGYVLKSDLSGFSAAQVALSLIKQTPFLDSFIVFLQDNGLFFWKFYIWHILFLPLLISYAIYKHVKTLYTPYWVIGLGITLFLMLVFDLPKDIAYESVVQRIHGPWFFWGAEGMLLKAIPVIVVDIVFFTLFALLIAFYFTRFKKSLLALLLLWVGIYAFYSFI